jgi:hypothetical protein
MAAVQKDGFALKYVQEEIINQTIEQTNSDLLSGSIYAKICMAAVQNNPLALHYVTQQTPEICMAAVQKLAYVLRFVKYQTLEICMVAVQQNGNTLQYVHNQTDQICIAAVQRLGCALQYVKIQTLDICMTAIQKNGASCIYIKAELFDHDEYIYMMYSAIFKSKIFTIQTGNNTIANRIFHIKYKLQCSNKLIDEITILNSRTTKRAIKH